MAVDIYLLRHAQSEHNSQGLIQGHVDSPLSAEGRLQATAAGKYLAQEFDAVYASDLSRCKDTASLVLAETNAKMPPETYMFNLRERHLGELQNMRAVDARAMCAERGHTFHDYGETGEKARRRSVEAFLWILQDIKDHKYQRVLVVSHGSVVPRILKVMAEENLLQLENLTVEDIGTPHNASVSHLRLSDDKLVLREYARSGFLKSVKPVNPDVI